MFKNWKVRILFFVLVGLFAVTFSLGIFLNPNFTVYDLFLGLSTEFIGLVVALVLVESYVSAKKKNQTK